MGIKQKIDRQQPQGVNLASSKSARASTSASLCGVAHFAIYSITLVSTLMTFSAHSQPLTASYYSTESLKKEGTFYYSKGIMANGKKFDENNFTCATRLYPLGTLLCVVNTATGNKCFVKVTDRIGKRFAKTRIDLSKKAFMAIADLRQGLVKVEVKEVER